MASSAMAIARKPFRRRSKPRLVVMDGGRELPAEEAEVFLLSANERFNARNLERRVERANERHADFPERRSVAIAMLAVEEQIVKALWTIARQPLGRVMPMPLVKCGLEYMYENTDVHSIYTDAAGGKWDTVAPRPALPSAKEISVADRVQQWLLLVRDEGLRKLLVIGATSKRGDAARRIPWVMLKLPQRLGVTSRTCQRRYDEALRIIADGLTVARMGK